MDIAIGHIKTPLASASGIEVESTWRELWYRWSWEMVASRRTHVAHGEEISHVSILEVEVGDLLLRAVCLQTWRQDRPWAMLCITDGRQQLQ